MNLDYFLRGYMKALMYDIPVDSVKELFTRLSVAAVWLLKIYVIFATVL